jgi:hypothetical protein
MLSMGQQGTFIAVLMLSGATAREAHAMRYVKVVVSVDGKPILESSRGDRGDQDADEVWGYLKQLTFKPTEEFAAAQRGTKTVALESMAPVGQNGEIVIDMPYGGRAQTRHLKLIRVSRDDAGREWKLDPEECDRLYDTRTITRSQAARLKNPKAAGA